VAASGAAAGGAMPAGVASGTAMAVDLKERERELILATLRQTGGSRKLTAERLGISPRTLRHKLQALKAAGVSVPRLHEQQFAAV
jgi:two-component system response regulator FlrC